MSPELSFAIGPSSDELSPLKQKPRLRFPVLPSLSDNLATATNHPMGDIAYTLATCSGYAYSDADTLAMMMARMGLFNSHCRKIVLANDAMFINSTAYLVQSEDGRSVILCYRGTSPMNFVDWLLDADVEPEKISLLLSPNGTPNPDHWVHSGMYRNMRATRYKVVEALQRAMDGRSVIDDDRDPMAHPMEALYITGHSLGGAMAALMALILLVEPAYDDIRDRLRAVYTFGQPMVGSPAIAEYCEQAGLPLFRYVHSRDVVPHVPPRESGPFAHFGAEYQYQDGDRKWMPRTTPIQQVNLTEFATLAPSDFVIDKVATLRDSSTRWNEVAGRVNNLLPIRLANGITNYVAQAIPMLEKTADILRLPLVYSFVDHSPNHYISKLAPEGVLSEFGDVR